MIKLDLKDEINLGIKTIRADIIHGVSTGVQLNGKPYTANKQSVIDRKGFDGRLIGGGNKRFANQRTYGNTKATKSKQEGTLFFKSDKDAEIGKYNQTPTGKGAIASSDAAVFWGVSEDAIKKIDKRLDVRINNLVDEEIESWGFKKV